MSLLHIPRINIQSISSKEKEIIQFILVAINITPLLPYSPLCLAGGPISAAETRLVWNMLQCCRAAVRGVGGPRVCSQLVLRDAARQDPRPPTHPRTAHSRHGDTAETGAVFAHITSLLLLLLLLLVLLLVLLSRD